MSFRERLRQEFESRRKGNPRYSLRAMAVFLDTDHSPRNMHRMSEADYSVYVVAGTG